MTLTLTFKLVRARDQTRLLCEFGANSFIGSRGISYTNKKPQTDGAKNRTFRTSLPFTACGKKLKAVLQEAVTQHIQMIDETVRLCTLPGIGSAAETRLCVFSTGADGHGNRNIDVLLPYATSHSWIIAYTFTNIMQCYLLHRSTAIFITCQIWGGDGGGGHWLVWMEWRPAGWSVCLPLLIFPCTIKSTSSLLAPAHLGGPRKRAAKTVVCVCVCQIWKCLNRKCWLSSKLQKKHVLEAKSHV